VDLDSGGVTNLADSRRGPNVTPRTRLERFRTTHGIRPTLWAREAAITRQSLGRIRHGTDTHLSTIRAILQSASKILGRPVRVSEVFDVGEDTPGSEIVIVRIATSAAQRKTLKHYSTRLDRILRGENITPNDFARHVGIGRQSLLRLRSGIDEPSLYTLSNMVRVLRLMTGKPYTAGHLYDVGEGLKPFRSAL
jgi:predicted transcriptional regulator